MKRYVVVFEESAQSDVRESYDWGCRVWGKKQAQRWLRELRTAVSRQLSIVPKGFPLAPETTISPKRFARWLWVDIVFCSRLERAKFVCCTSEARIVSSHG